MSSNLTRCPTCDDLTFNIIGHRCNPMWAASVEDLNEDSPFDIRAIDANHAAEKAAELYNEDGDYPMMSGDPTIKVTVTGPDGEQSRFEVRAEASIDYYAEEL